jgi:preprotein translocase subunit Sec61beta
MKISPKVLVAIAIAVVVVIAFVWLNIAVLSWG